MQPNVDITDLVPQVMGLEGGTKGDQLVSWVFDAIYT